MLKTRLATDVAEESSNDDHIIRSPRSGTSGDIVHHSVLMMAAVYTDMDDATKARLTEVLAVFALTTGKSWGIRQQRVCNAVDSPAVVHFESAYPALDSLYNASSPVIPVTFLQAVK